MQRRELQSIDRGDFVIKKKIQRETKLKVEVRRGNKTIDQAEGRRRGEEEEEEKGYQIGTKKFT